MNYGNIKTVGGYCGCVFFSGIKAEGTEWKMRCWNWMSFIIYFG